ncbi:hypothetical protein NLI96_g6741 [Meripilus lineatus]|uniref:Sister chromatid cohesion protein PDS5 n=1 Tax=Meripilus lineatus TaxID=2056292 RepID=A0AAD5V5Q3_9APHY|nr:hypothetical protein NLI96_g6741 [Physisporinus lineatus]
MVAQTRTGGNSPKKLKFHDRLTGKQLTIDALQKKLKSLHNELAEMDQEQVDTHSLSTVRKELIHPTILLHKDKGVRAYAACCLADLLRLYAPDAPYTQAELRDIFQFFIRQLTQGLRGADSPYYNEFFHLLESLSTVKSVVLVCDLPNADELMADIFKGFFEMINLDLAKKIELFVADILIALIDECQSLPQDVLELILDRFKGEDTRMEQSSYRLAVQVCNATADKLQRHVCQYFTDLIVNNAREEDFEEVRSAHELIKRLNRACPSLLHNVVPQLEEELKVEEVAIRLMATQVLGEMFADKGGTDFIKKYPSTWGIWLHRKNDKSPSVRLAFVEATKGIITNLAEMREQVEEALLSKLLDPEEKVRAAVCKMYSQLDYETALHHVSDNQLQSVAGRGVDKKHSVQVEASHAVGRLYSLAYPEIENNDPAAIRQFSWIPQALLHNAMTTPEVKAIVEQVFAEYILPLPTFSASSSTKPTEVDEVAWTDRLIFTMRFLDEQAVNILIGISGIKLLRPTLYERYLQSCIDNNGGVIDDDEEAVIERLNVSIKQVASMLPDTQKVTDDLQAFAKLNENRLYKLLKTCMDSQTDLKGLVKATNEFNRRLEQSSSNLLPTMTTLLRRASLRIVNQSSIPTLIKRVQKGVDGQAHAQAALLVEVCLQALSAAAQSDKKLAPSDKRTFDRLMRYVVDSNHRHAKFAIRLLMSWKNHEEICDEVVESITDGLPEASPETRAAHISVLAQIALRAPSSFEQKSDVITAFLLKKVLMVSAPRDPDAMDVDEEWVDDADMSPELRAKIYSLKACRNRCLAHSKSKNAEEIAKPVLTMFSAIINNAGSLKQDSPDDYNTLPPGYIMVPFLAVHDPEADIVTKAKAYISYALTKWPKTLRLSQFEMGFIRLLHLIAHHPDFAISEETLPDIAKYIEFYLELVATQENLPLLYHLALKAKTVRDAESHAHSENLYAAGELAQHLIKSLAKSHGWTVESYPGKVRLPGDILRPLPSAEAANKILQTTYLPENTLEWLSEKAKQNRANAELKEKAKGERKTTSKRKASAKENGNSKRPRTKGKRRKNDDSDEESSLTESSDEDGEGAEGPASPPRVEPDASDEENEAPEPTTERPGRGARTRAKVMCLVVLTVIFDTPPIRNTTGFDQEASRQISEE